MISTNKSKGLHLKPQQGMIDTQVSPYLIQTIQPNSIPIWGTSHQYDVKIKNFKIHELIVGLQLPAITGITGGSGGYYVPSDLMIDSIDVIVSGGQTVQQIYGTSNFIINETMRTDEQRYTLNAFGDYKTTANRITRSGASNWWYISLKSLFNTANYPLIASGHEFSLKINLCSSADSINVNGGTGTPVSVITNGQLICRVSQMGTDELTQTTQYLLKNANLSYLFHDFKRTLFPVASGSTSSSHTLGGMVGVNTLLFFIVRPASSMVGDSKVSFVEIKDFELKASGGASLCGGSPISSVLSLTQLSKWWSASSYLSEAYGGSSNSYVYFWSHSGDTVRSVNNGSMLGSRMYDGFENLFINYKSALGSAHTVELFAMQNTALVQTMQKVIKQSDFR